MKHDRAKLRMKTMAGALAISAFAGPSAHALPRDAAAVYKPSGLTMAVENGYSDFVGLSNDGKGGYAFGVATARDHSAIPTLRTGLPSTAYVRYAFSGRFFRSDWNDDVCVFIRGDDPVASLPEVQCWAFDSPRNRFLMGIEFLDTDFARSLPLNVGPNSPYGYVVGDFDRDGFDEVLTIDASGGGAQFWKFDATTHLPHVQPWHLDLSPYHLQGALQILTANDGGHLVVYDPAAAVVVVLQAMAQSSGVTFEWFGTVSVPHGNIQIAVADGNGDGWDDLVINDLDRGVLEWRTLDARYFGDRLPVSQGQISVTPGQYITPAWTNPNYFSPNADDLVVYDPNGDWISIEEDHTNGTSEDYEWYWTFTGADVRSAMHL